MNSLTITDYLMLRKTVDVLYDIQDVRMRTANRLRLMPKQTSKVYVAPLAATEDALTKEIEGFLSKVPIYTLWMQNVKGIGPRLAGSIIAQTMIRFERVSASDYKKMKLASQKFIETQQRGASQINIDAQSKRASQERIDAHIQDASHTVDENQIALASQRITETQQKLASHESIENQNDDASQNLNDTQSRIASRKMIETHRHNASQQKLDSQMRDASHPRDETHSNIASQGSHETRQRIAFSQEQLELAQKTDRGDYLIPVLRGIGAFDTVSKYWAWWGLHVVDGKAPKRSRGDRINWNSALRTLAWKIGKQFVLQGEHYRKVYDDYKERISATRLPVGICPQYQECLAKMKRRAKPACKGHIDAMARRYAVKMFLSHLWEKWRTLDGFPVRAPYVIDKMGHTSMTVPVESSQEVD